MMPKLVSYRTFSANHNGTISVRYREATSQIENCQSGVPGQAQNQTRTSVTTQALCTNSDRKVTGTFAKDIKDIHLAVINIKINLNSCRV